MFKHAIEEESNDLISTYYFFLTKNFFQVGLKAHLWLLGS